MEIQTTIEIIPANNDEIRKDKEYHLRCYRAMKSIKKLNEISKNIVMGKLYVDSECCAIIDGIRWDYV